MQILALLGFIIALVGSIWFLVVAFRAHIAWGVVCLLIPIASLIFLVTHWGKAWRPFFMQIAGAVIVCLAAVNMARSGELAVGPMSSPWVLARSVLSRQQMGVEDDSGPRPQVGETLESVVDRLGPPNGYITSGRQVSLLYRRFTVVSEDGITVIDVENTNLPETPSKEEAEKEQGATPSHDGRSGERVNE